MQTKNRSVVIFIIALIIIGLVSFFIVRNRNNVALKDRQAVFLTNGQAYFGKLANPTDQFVKLTDVYYLPPQERLQDGSSKENKKISLIKLGQELHGPFDVMYINRDHVLFFEDMRNESKINDAIKRFLEQGATPTPEASPSDSPTPSP